VGLGYAARGPIAGSDLTRVADSRNAVADSQAAAPAVQPDPEPSPANPAGASRDRNVGKSAGLDEAKAPSEFRKATSGPPSAPAAERQDVASPRRQTEEAARETRAGAAAPQPAPPVTSNLPAASLQARARLETPALGRINPADAVGEVLTFSEALQRLDGTIRLIPGLIPERLQAIGPVVQVVYPGGLILAQELVDGRVIFRLTGPAGFPADSLERLRSRVRE
jgi:hypothetical protein